MYSEYEVKKLICEIGKRVYQNGFVAANDGNISVRLNEREIIVTPTGVSKGYMTPDMLIKIDINGKVISGTWKPSSEIKMHLRVYKEREDVKAVVHAHPPYATSYAIAGIPLNKPIMPEAVIALGSVPIAEYGTPSTEEIPDAISKYLQKYDALLLENHGALTYAGDLMGAYFKMESLEFYAKLSYISENLGGPRMLSCTNVDKLLEVRRNMGLPGRHPGCEICDSESCEYSPRKKHTCSGNCKNETQEIDVEAIVASVTKKVVDMLNKR